MFCGEYFIGKRYINLQYRIDWYNFYFKKEDNFGYYGYIQCICKGCYVMGFYLGIISLGCVIVRVLIYNSD